MEQSLTNEYLLKIAPDISIFEMYDRYDALGLQENPNMHTTSLNDNNFNRIIYRIIPVIEDHEKISSDNSFLHIFDVNDATYIIAICNQVKTTQQNDFVRLNIADSIIDSIDGVGF